jgi:hypothetical protein
MYSRTMLAIGISISDRRRDWAYLRSIRVAFNHVRSLFVAAEEHGFLVDLWHLLFEPNT